MIEESIEEIIMKLQVGDVKVEFNGKRKDEDDTNNSSTSTSNTTSTAINASDATDSKALVSRLLQEVQQLRNDKRKLSQQMEAERLARYELESAKNKLTAEIEELTRNLFEEANGMVAVEAQARWNLQQSQVRLEGELKKTRDLLEMERDQSRVLKAIFEEEKVKKKCNDPVLWDVDVFGARMVGSYYEDFFPEKVFDSRSRGMTNTHWDGLSSRTVESGAFRQFSDFVDECFRVSVKGKGPVSVVAESTILAILGHPFMKSCLRDDIEPCLSFPVTERGGGKLKSLLKKLLPAMLKNTCIIEPLAPLQSSNSSPLYATSPLLSPESIRGSPLSIRSFISIAPPVRSKTNSPIKSVSINIPLHGAPQTDEYAIFGSSPASISSIESCPVSCSTSAPINNPLKCSLCESSQSFPTHRLRITSSSSSALAAQWNPICKPCRDRLVSVASLFTTLRHLLQGLHAHRPKLDVYFDFIQAKRYMFYTRCGVDQEFYALSDFEAFSKKICE